MYAKILLMTAVLLSGQVYAQSASDTTPVVVAKKKKKKKKPADAVAASADVTAPVVAPVVEVKKEEVKPAVVVAPPATAFQYMKDHFSASYHGEFYAVRRDVYSANPDDHTIQDFKIMHNPTVIYKPTPDWLAMATAEFKYSDQPNKVAGPAYPNDFYRALFTVTRKNIVTEKEKGIQLDAGVGRRVFNTGSEQAAGGHFPLPSYGNDRAFTTLTKNWGKSNASLFLQYLYNDYKKTSATTWKHGLEVIPTLNLQLTEKLSYLFNDDINFNTPKLNAARDFSTTHEMNVAYLNYQWTDKINTYYQFKYYHNNNFTKDPQTEDDYFEHYAGIGYAFNPKATVTFEVGSEVVHARDGRDFFSKKIAYPELALYVDLSL